MYIGVVEDLQYLYFISVSELVYSTVTKKVRIYQYIYNNVNIYCVR